MLDSAHTTGGITWMRPIDRKAVLPVDGAASRKFGSISRIFGGFVAGFVAENVLWKGNNGV